MKPPASAPAQTRLSARRTTPEIVSPTRRLRTALVMAMPGISSMMSPIRIISMCSIGSSIVTPPTPSPISMEISRFEATVLMRVRPR